MLQAFCLLVCVEFVWVSYSVGIALQHHISDIFLFLFM